IVQSLRPFTAESVRPVYQARAQVRAPTDSPCVRRASSASATFCRSGIADRELAGTAVADPVFAVPPGRTEDIRLLRGNLQRQPRSQQHWLAKDAVSIAPLD